MRESPEAGHVLIVAYHYPPENIVGAQRPFRFAKYLPEFGYRVSILTAAPQGNGAARNVHYVPDQASGRRSLWELVIRKFVLDGEVGLPWVAPAIRSSRALAAREGVTAVISTSPPPVTHAVALALKRSCGAAWIADFRDPMVGNPLRTNLAAPYVDRVFERQIFRHADAVIANTDAVAELWRKRYPKWAGKISVVWNGVDSAAGVSAAPIPARAYRTLVHTGVICRGRYPVALLAGLDRLAQRGLIDSSKLRIQFIGGLDGQDQFHRAA